MADRAHNFNEAVQLIIKDSDILSKVVNGTSLETVTIEDGTEVPTVRKTLIDNFKFKDPIDWVQGESEPDFLQIRRFTDGTMWYAPNARKDLPIPMGLTPVGDNNWVIAIVSADLISLQLKTLAKQFDLNYKGAYSVGVVFDKFNDVYVYNDDFYGVVSTVTLPYTAIEADPANDANLMLRGGASKLYVNKTVYDVAPMPWIGGETAIANQTYLYKGNNSLPIEVYTSNNGEVMGNAPDDRFKLIQQATFEKKMIPQSVRNSGFIDARAMGVIADYYLDDGSVNPNPTDNKDALNSIFSPSAGLPVKKVSRVVFPNGGIYTTDTFVIEGGGKYQDDGVEVTSFGSTRIIKGGATTTAPYHSVIYLKMPTKSGSYACANVSISNLYLISDTADAAIASLDQVTFFSSDRVNTQLTKVGADSYYFSNFFYINSITNGFLRQSGKAINQFNSGTTNWFDRIFAFACDNGAYVIRSVYSAIGSLAADNCAGVLYDFRFCNISANSLGMESENATEVIRSNAQVDVGQIYCQNIDNSAGLTIIKGQSGSKINVENIFTYVVGETSKINENVKIYDASDGSVNITIGNYSGYIKTGKTSNIANTSNVTLRENDSNFFAIRDGDIAYTGGGFDGYVEVGQDAKTNKVKSIYLNSGSTPKSLINGSDVRFYRAPEVGDLFLCGDPSSGIAAYTTISKGVDINSSTYGQIRYAEVVSNTAGLPTSNLGDGVRTVRVKELRKSLTYYAAFSSHEAGWYDESGTKIV